MPEPSIEISTSISLMFTEVPPLERYSAARRAGFSGVEIQVIDDALPADRAALAAGAADIPVVLLNVSLGDFRSGGPGLSGVPGRERAFREAFLVARDAATRLGARFLHLGPSRTAGADRAGCLEVYRGNLRYAVEAAAGHPFRLMIEPLNRVENPDILIDDFDLAARLIGEIGGDSVGLQYDLYHATLGGVDLVATFDRHRSMIHHIQFADAPGRHEPGTGRCDFARFLRHLAATGYRGFIGAEYFPSRPTPETLGWLSTFRDLVRQ